MSDRLMSDFNAATKRLKDTGGRAVQGAENAYGASYQALVRAGLKPQIKHKYRVPKG